MKKSWLILVLALVVAVAAACGGGQQTAAPTAAPQAAPPKAAAPTTAPAAAPTTAPAAPAAQATAPAAAPKNTDAPKAAATTAPAAAPAAKVDTGKGGVLRFPFTTYPDSIDPGTASYSHEIALLRMIYEGLTTLDSKLNVVPGAAESWKVSDDGLTWTFKIRSGLKWADGKPLTAKDFEYTLKRAASPELAGQYQSSTFDIVGAEEYGTADPKKLSPQELQALRDKVHVKALDDTTLEIKTKFAAAYFPSVMTLWITYPVRQDVVEKGGPDWWVKAENHVGNGPFKLQELKEKQVAVMVPNSNYRTPPKLERLEFRYINDSKVSFEAYKNGELDVISLAAEDLEAAQKDATLSKEIVRYGQACTIGMIFNQTRPPFNNRDARLAFGKSLDRDAWVKDVLRGIGKTTTAWIPPGIPGHNAQAGGHLKYEPAAAKEIWTKAAQTGEVKLTFSSTPRNKTRFEFIAAQIQKSLGITPTLDPVESTTFTALTKSQETYPLITITGWCADYPDPQNWMSVYWDSKAFAQRYGYKNEKVDQLQKQADAEKDPQKRIQLYQEAEKLVLDDVAIAPVWNTENVFLVKPYVKGYSMTAQDHFPGEFNVHEITAVK